MEFSEKVDRVLAQWAVEIPQGTAIFSVAKGELSRTALVAYLVACSGRSLADQFRVVRETLIRKNKAYGDSALSPVRVFAKSDTSEQIRVRLDDKLSRLKRGTPDGEDVILDLLGYLVILTISESDATTVKIIVVDTKVPFAGVKTTTNSFPDAYSSCKDGADVADITRWGFENGKIKLSHESDECTK
jgi:hypothetical protein